MPRSITNKFLLSRRSSGSSQVSSGSVFSRASSFLTDPDPEELDCFRSMRGVACDNTRELNDAMQDDVQDLTSRLVSVRKSGEAEKRVHDEEGQAYQVVVTKDDVRLCHVDEKGHYHFEHFGAYNRKSNANDRSRSSPPYSNDNHKRQRRRDSWQIVDDGHGRPFLLISSMWVIVLHRDGIWCCQRVMGKVLDSDTSKGVTAQAPKPWLRKRGRQNIKPNVFRGRQDSDDALSRSDSETEDKKIPEPLLCANTPGERGQHPLAHQSFYHDW